MFTRIPIFKDQFDDGSQDLPVLPGNGSVSETGGALVVSVPNGVNADWYTFGRNGILPYVGVAGLEEYTKVYYEFTIKSWTTANTAYSCLVVGACASDTVMWWLFTQDGTNFGVQKNWGGSNLGTVTTTLPRKFRFVWEKPGATQASQTMAVQYLNSSGVWTNIVAPQAVSMTPVRLGLGIKTWNQLPACNVQYDDVEIYAESYQRLNTDPAGVEDQAFLPAVGGPAAPGTWTPMGWLPPEKGGGIEDIASFPIVRDLPKAPAAGVEDIAIPTVLPAAPVVEPSGLEESYCIETLVPTYTKGYNDADGREFIGDTVVYDVLAYDTTGESWSAPVAGNGFYGAARDGKHYHNGYECGPVLNGTSFGTMAGGFNSRTWMTDIEPNAVGSHITKMTMSMVSDDHVRFTAVNLTAWEYKMLSSRMRWCLVGDFDVEVRFENRSASGGSDGNVPALLASVDDSNKIYVRRHHNNLYDTDVQINGSYGYYLSSATTDTFGRLRLVRSGSSVTSYYWNNGTAAWVLLRTAVTNSVFAKPMRIDVHVGGTGGLNIASVDVFGFVINSGTAVNTVGWAREAAGTYRGSRADFPTKALICASRYVLDIIDLQNNKLWMRFVGATNNALHNASIATRRVAMKNGMLLLSYTSGGCVCIDFTTDDIRLHSAASETWTGSILRAYNGVYWANTSASGRDCGPVGIIACRNLAGGYYGDNNNWQTPSTTINDASLYERDGYLFKAEASIAGMGGHKWKRWYNDGGTPYNWWAPGVGKGSETTVMRWCEITSDGDLFYLDGTTIYSANYATWNAKIGGALQTWTADYSKALPGTRKLDSQYRAAIVGGDVFVPTNEGVYKASWPSGSFLLTYGWSGSGATYPLLCQFVARVLSIRVVKDGDGTTLLALGIQFFHDSQVWSQIVLVNPATNTTYGVSPAVKARTIWAETGA